MHSPKTEALPEVGSISLSYFRRLAVVFLAFSVSLPIALMSLAKLVLFVCGFVVFFMAWFRKSRESSPTQLWAPWVVIATIAMAGVGLLWTPADLGQASVSFVKHAKLLTIPLLIYLISNRAEARLGLVSFVAGQTLVLVSSWLMACDISLFWVQRPSGHNDLQYQYIPYADSYLDQSIMLASTAAIIWLVGKGSANMRPFALFLSVAALLNVIVLMPGRTAYLLVISIVSLSVMWEIKPKFRVWVLMLAPAILVTVIFNTVPQVQQRVNEARTQLSNYVIQPESHTAIGLRLSMWHLSLLAIQESPVTGHGVGNWTPTIKRLYGQGADQVFGPSNGSNPHQEFLLWAVEMGLPGAMLLFGLAVALVFDSWRFQKNVRQTVWSLLGVIGLACMFNSPLYDDLLGDYFCVALGLVMALGLHNREKPNFSNGPYGSRA